MNKESNKQARFVYPMSQLRKKLTDEQIAKYSEKYDFNEKDAFFHYDEDAEMLESLNEDEINFYNEGMEPTNKLITLAA